MDLDSKNTPANVEKINPLTEKIMSSPDKNSSFEEKLEQMTAFIEKSTTEASARMTRLEEQELAASERLQKLDTAIAANISSIKDLNLAVNQMFQVVEVNQRNFEVVQQNFEIIVAQIRGLQNENRNILDHLFGIQEDGGEEEG